ncbi:MAG: N-6 DNA methylase [Nautiliaceae bacterium]
MSEKDFLHNLEKKLWKSAEKLRSNLDAAVYKHVVLGLIFLKYVSDSFEARRKELENEFRNPNSELYLGDDEELIKEELEVRDYYTEKNVFWVPEIARWKYIQENIRLSIGAKLPDGKEFKSAGKLIDDALEAIERENPKLKRVLNKDYARLQIEQSKLADLVDLISEIPFEHESLKAKDILGHVYEYFLGQFAAAEGKKGGQFYTPKSIVNLIVEMIEPYKGKVYDPAMGSGGFFISSEKFIEAHGGRIEDISIYGQESNPTTWRLAIMNMVIRGLDFNFGKEPADTFTKDQHPDLRADFVLANPPFNQDEWWHPSLENDRRWIYGTPPKSNANFAWMQHMLYHTAPNGVVGLVLANGSLSSTTGGEDKIRENIVKTDLVEAIIALPDKLFFNTGIPASIWILNKNKPQKGKTLFIDARDFGQMLDRKQRILTEKDIKEIASTFHKFRKGEDVDKKGVYKVALIEDIEKENFILTPGRYVGIAESDEEKEPFKEKMEKLTKKLSSELAKNRELESLLIHNLKELGFSLEDSK